MPQFTAFQTQQYAAGIQSSPAVSYNGKGTIVRFDIQSTTWQTDDTSIIWALRVLQSFDQGATWEWSETEPHNGQVFGFSCSPGTHLNKQGQPVNPSGEFQVDDGLGTRLVMAQVTTTGTLTWGLTGSTRPA